MATIHLDSKVRDSLLARIIPIDHPPALWPATNPGINPENFAATRGNILDHLWGEPGWVLIDTGLADCDDDDVASGAWNLFAALCRPVQQYRTGELIHSVAVATTGAQASSHYSQSNKADGFHTDGTLLDTTPEIAMLAGIYTADQGGETVIIDGRPIVSQLLDESSRSLAALGELHPFHSGDNKDPVVAHRVIDHRAQPAEIRYMRRYIEFGYQQMAQEVSESLRVALEELDALTENPQYQAAIMVERGYALLWNNRRCLHGRRTFTEYRQRRRLLRTYGVRT